ncbi:zinc-dependent alcohol dehydrogenase family protein [Streptomyces hilarionis]|uniref:zinc-dependent alcohol dehydrogenase family protein n=1 Tax=Streptomyces hilarionis TaxID=2839954 RepID=UPI00211A09F2|nr:NAD(P)-dependent alcohol dehydrogenase [Streptomyces hilarionis]MCQ9133833.1 NAD(P)-dependent alcohol dehydrogenase [Streptomyces hilarionis]
MDAHVPGQAPTPADVAMPSTPRTPQEMTAWTTRGDGIDRLSAVRVPVPTPGPTEVLVKMSAVSLNYRDLLVVGGVDHWTPAQDVVPVSDGVGAVAAIGSEVTRWRPGDRVSAGFLPRWRSGPLTEDTYVSPVGGPVNRGMLAEYVLVEQDEAVRTAHSLDDVHAATLPVAGVTAWHAVGRRGRVRPGETVLVHGTGGVALFAAQLTLALGATPIVTSGSDEKLDRLRALGVDRTINYRRTEDLAAEVLRMTGGEGVDHVVETVGGDNLNRSLEAVKVGGSISFIGLIAGRSATVDVYRFVTKNVTVHGIETGSLEMLGELAAFVDEHGITPVIDSVLPAERVQEALRHLEGGRHFGKIVVTLPGTDASTAADASS